MKLSKNAKLAAAIFAIIFVTFNVIIFAIFGFEDHSATFWISYAFIVIGVFAAAGVMAILYRRGLKIKDWLFGYPVVRHTVIYLIAEFVVGMIFIILQHFIDDFPFGVALAVQFVLLAFYGVMAISCFIAKETIDDIQTKVGDKTRFVKLLRADAEILVEKCGDPETRAKCEKLAEAIRYSDPMSNDVLFELEKEIALTVSQCDAAVENRDYVQASELCDRAMLLLSERNKKCKALK